MDKKQLANIYLKYKICVAGAASSGHCSAGALEQTKGLGRQIIKQNGVLITGATTGIPYWAAIGAKEAEGISIGVSPANSQTEHVSVYKLPIDYFDLIVYTGFDYSGRNLIMTKMSDAIIVSCGRMGTLNEFTIAFEDKKPIGVLVKSGGTADLIKQIVKSSHRGPGKIVYDKDPKKLVKKIIKLIDEENTLVKKKRKLA